MDELGLTWSDIESIAANNRDPGARQILSVASDLGARNVQKFYPQNPPLLTRPTENTSS
jgi:hypothetical protein